MSTALQGQRILVIGGSKYLGEAIARAAAAQGAGVIIGARNLEQAEHVATGLRGASAIRIDVTDEATIAAAASQLRAVDHIVITASAHHNVSVSELDKQSILTAFDAKVVGPMLVAKHFAPTMTPGGSLLLFSGVAAWNPGAPYTVMGVTNGAVSFLVQHLANELAPVRVNAISPGIINSGTWDDMGAEAKQHMMDDVAASNLAGRPGLPEDITDAALWLLGAGFVTGETVHVEGGAQYA